MVPCPDQDLQISESLIVVDGLDKSDESFGQCILPKPFVVRVREIQVKLQLTDCRDSIVAPPG